MIIIKKETYKCEHCRKLYEIKLACEKHESKLCRKNPINKHRCYDGCNHLIKKEADITYFDHEGYDYQHKKELLYCESKNIFVHPFWLGNPYLQEDINDGLIDNIVMPKECKDFTEYE